MAQSFLLIKVQVDKKSRVELYSTAAAQSADATRAIGTAPTPGTAHGVICDMAFTGATDFIMSPAVPGCNFDESGSPPALTGDVTYAITNTDTTSQAVTVTFTFVPLEQ